MTDTLKNTESVEQSGRFRFAEDAKHYAKKLGFGRQTNPVLEFYWLCAQLGLVSYDRDKTLPDPPGPGNDLVDNFVGRTRHHQVLIRSFLLYRYLASNSYDIDELEEEEAEEIEQLMDGFLQSTGSHLRNKGMRTLDTFAQKGWDLLKSKSINLIDDMGLFLVQYVKLIHTFET